jgi:Phage integrase family.
LAIGDYLEWRKRIYGSIEDNEPLFAKLGSYAYKQFSISGVELWRIFKQGLKATNIDPTACTFHALRRSFKKVCIRAGVDYEAREAMMGHKITGRQLVVIGRIMTRTCWQKNT